MDNRDIRLALAARRGEINPDIARGMAVKHMESAEDFIREAILSNQPGLTPVLTLDKIGRATAPETFRVRSTSTHVSALQYDVTRTDAYLLKIQYKFHNEPLYPIYVNIPFVGEYGELYIRDSPYHVIPVLADKLFSVNDKEVFISLQKDPMKIERTNHSCRCNGKRNYSFVLWSRIHKARQTERAKGKAGYGLSAEAKTTLPHYLFARFGVVGAFKRLYGIDVIPVDVKEMPEYNEEVFDLYTTNTTAGSPNTVIKNMYQDWSPTNIALLVKRDDVNEQVLAMIIGMFYVLDTFPDHFRGLDYLNDESTWRITLGHLVWNKPQNEGQLDENIRIHLTQTTDHYLDLDTQGRLAKGGYFCADYYEFLRELIKIVPRMFNEVDPTSMRNKRLTVLRYVLSDLVREINTLGYKVQALMRSDKATLQKVNQLITCSIKPDLVINALTKSHPECVNVSYPNDNPLFKVTSQIIPQLSTMGAPDRSNPIKDPNNVFHPDIAAYGSFCAPAQSEGAGRKYVNLLAPTDEQGGFLPSPYLPVLDAIKLVYFTN